MCITEYNEVETMELFKEEGRIEGRIEGQKEMVAAMLRDGRSPQEIAEFCKYPLNLILEVQKENS